MTDDDADLSSLRERAETILRRSWTASGEPTVRPRSLADAARDLSLHRIELDLQRADLERVREELDQSAEEYARLYDFAPAGIVSIDGDGLVTRANLAAGRLLRTERGRLVGRPLAGFIAPDDRAELDAVLREVRRTGSSGACELDLAVSDDTPVCVVLDAHRSMDGTGWELALIDMSEIRAAQREISELAHVAARAEIGLQLHDTVLQRLFGVSSSLQALMTREGLDEDAKAVVRRLADDVHATVLTIWNTVFEQRP